MAQQKPDKPITAFLIKMRADGSKVAPTIERFVQVLEENYAGNVRLNEMTGRPEFRSQPSDGWSEWTDAQESALRGWFQTTLGLYSRDMFNDALNVFFERQKVNPLTDLLDGLQWDGVERMEHFLHYVAGTPDDAYHREVSRLLFAGGTHRAYRPGCKFDDMIVFTGRQGSGKSTLVRFLNISDEWFREIKIITGKEGIESLRGAWIAEMSELMAMTRVKEMETVKAFITTQVDSYRPPYAKNVKTIPRRCVFVGTTNNPQFLSDRTGNRRFYPVNVRCSGDDILRREEAIREYILQCWAEAVYKFKAGELQPFARYDLREIFVEAQEDAMEDDWRVGAIKDYLEREKKAIGENVCVIELWHRALGEPEDSKPQRKDSIEITYIMQQMPDWVREKKAVRAGKWGVQKVFVKVGHDWPGDQNA